MLKDRAPHQSREECQIPCFKIFTKLFYFANSLDQHKISRNSHRRNKGQARGSVWADLKTGNMWNRETEERSEEQKPLRVKAHRTFLSLWHVENRVRPFHLIKNFWNDDTFALSKQWLKEAAGIRGVTKESWRSDSRSLSSLLLWNCPCFLPSGGFLRTEIHPGVPEATCCTELLQYLEQNNPRYGGQREDVLAA